MTLLTEKTVTVRKDHCCVWCGELIPGGARAIKRDYIFEGEFRTDYAHPECLPEITGRGTFTPHSGRRGLEIES